MTALQRLLVLIQEKGQRGYDGEAVLVVSIPVSLIEEIRAELLFAEGKGRKSCV